MDNKEKIFEKKVIKSASKAAGLKSTLSVGDKLYLTSFGKGNDAVLEQQIDTAADYAVTPISAEPSLTVTEAAEARVKFDSKRPNVKKIQLTADNPLHHSAGNPASTRRDILGLKNALEERFFGRTFDDTIHIQIIYNILDIEKILAEYATIISAALNHLMDESSDVSQSDVIGNIATQNPYAIFKDPQSRYDYRDPSLTPDQRKDATRIRKKIDANRAAFEALLATGRLGYFGFDYKPPRKDEKDKKKIKAAETQEKRLYHLVALAGQLRQWSFHGGDKPEDELWLYQLDSQLVGERKEFLDTLDYYYGDRFREINDHFIDQNKINLAILEEIYPEETFPEIAALYYDFIVVKSYKNMGFSIKKLREQMTTLEGASVITAQNMDSVRSKLYKLIDFSLFYRYYKDEARRQRAVDILRASTTDEEKEAFYAAEAEWNWNYFRGRFTDFCLKIGDWVKMDVDASRWNGILDLDSYRRTSTASYFSKLLYAMSFFLDGKEINILFTTLINKFENIASFITTAKELSIDVTFHENYAFFNQDCDGYAREIDVVRNIARMKKPVPGARKTMYRDALTVLGIPEHMQADMFDAELEKMLEKPKDEKGRKLKGKNPFRNFIANNVIESNRFIYVVKFCNPDKVRSLVNNTVVTKFVLGRMPETQIDRYYQSCIANPDSAAPLAARIDALADMMRNMRFEDFKDVQQKSGDPIENMRKERFKAIIRLYLAVVYQLVKNLVNVNSRYVIAFHCLERDCQIYTGKSVSKSKKYFTLIDVLLEEGDSSRSGYLARNVRMREHIAHDVDIGKSLIITTKSTDSATGEVKYSKLRIIGFYRNNIAHLTAVRSFADYIGDIARIDSYFGLYHYIVQRLLQSRDYTAEAFPDRINPYYASLDRYHTYVKDFVKALNSPIGYNLPRFKNLSIQQLFDRNELQPEPKDDKAEES